MSRTVFCPEEVIVVSSGKEDIGKLAALGNDGKFDTSVIPEIDDLQAQITAEVTTREEAVTKLQANIDAEALARTNADVTLQSNIDSEASARESADQALEAEFSAEVTARTEADTTLQANIDTEVTARIAAVSDLQAQITKEVVDRTNADSVLQANIDAEASARAGADTTLQSNIDAEVAARTSADEQLQADLANYLPLTGGTMTGAIDMGSKKITNLADGTASGNAVHYGQFTASIGTALASSGYQKLPSGLILQWGTVDLTNGSKDVTFPIPFPNALFRVFVSEVSAEQWGTSFFQVHGPANESKTGFTAKSLTWNGSSFSLATADVGYLAIGY
ncbi:MAG: tail protein [Firmicutes bacterium]|nr:tail protein [Bacillota bacterium]